MHVASRDDCAESEEPAWEYGPPQLDGGGARGGAGLAPAGGGSGGADPQEAAPETEYRGLPPHDPVPKHPVRMAYQPETTAVCSKDAHMPQVSSALNTSVPFARRRRMKVSPEHNASCTLQVPALRT